MKIVDPMYPKQSIMVFGNNIKNDYISLPDLFKNYKNVYVIHPLLLKTANYFYSHASLNVIQHESIEEDK